MTPPSEMVWWLSWRPKRTFCRSGRRPTGLQVVQMVQDLHPDVVLMDVGMPRMDGIEATRRIKQEAPKTRVIVLTVYPTHRSEAFAAGASRYLLKDSTPRDLMQAIRDGGDADLDLECGA